MTLVAEVAHKERVDNFLAELNEAIASHRRSRRFDSGLYQFLVIGATIAGIASLAVGALLHDGPLAGIIGALTSVATVLSQQLHCVKAQNWHDRMVAEIDGIRLQLLYEHQSSPNEESLAKLSNQLRNVRSKMTAEWEKITSTLPAKLGNISRGSDS
ncbi:hypothetical protein [Bradyrhizobium sp. SZCCHNPS2010]|uniref:hypothetical protein n=1 Tax=Bradyrhizobium sp. SZCCHNPS2010 TaxID=3057333 RepID=UPI002915E247|nr:hypothetical protein [Bradyrhizobium sp. SZCCHNPS2010]